jgi:hypothetical protein
MRHINRQMRHINRQKPLAMLGTQSNAVPSNNSSLKQLKKKSVLNAKIYCNYKS